MADVILWVPALTALAGISGALGSQYVSHLLTRKREERAATAKLESERLFIATELVFHLEHFAEHCVNVATDNGFEDRDGISRFSVTPEDFSLNGITGDWRVLPRLLMYRIRELPLLQSGVNRVISSAAEHDDPPDYSDTFYERRYRYAWLGLKTIILSRRLRKIAELPATRLDATPWSAQPVLWKIWRQERKRLAIQARLQLQTITQFNVVLQESIKNNSLSERTQ